MAHSDSPRTNWQSTERLLLAGLLVFTLVVRGGVLWAMRGNLQQDPDAYRQIAENLLRHGEFAIGQGDPGDDVAPVRPTAFRPPLYPVVLSNLPAADGKHISLGKVAVLHVLLGVATVWLTWLTARRLLGAGGPEGRNEIAPTVRSGLDEENKPLSRSGGPTPDTAGLGAGPSGLWTWLVGSQSPTSRSGLLPVGPPGLGALLAGLLVACDPILLNQQTLIMTETLAAFLAVLGLWCLARFDGCRSWFNAALAGGAIGFAVLCRPAFLPWLGLVGLGMLLVRGGPAIGFQFSVFSWRQLSWRVLNVAALAVVSAAVISPWMIRNYRVFGKPVATTTHGGYTLLLGNNYDFYSYLRSGDTSLPWQPLSGSLFQDQRGDHLTTRGSAFELELDKACYEFATDAISDEFDSFVRACLYRLRQLWSPLPHKLTADESTGRRLLRYATAAWYCGVYVLAAIGVWRLRWKLLRPPWIWGVLLCLAFTAVHTFYWTNLRMRAPLVPFVAIVAGAAASSSRFKVQGSKLESQKL